MTCPCRLSVACILFKYAMIFALFPCRTGMAGVPGTASAIFGAVKAVGANVIMISQVFFTISFSCLFTVL